MDDPLRVMMPGQVWGLAAATASGPVYVTSYGTALSTTALTAVDLSGAVLWRRLFDGHPGPPRVTEGNVVWLAHRGEHGPVLAATGPDGSPRRTIPLPADADEVLGSFVVLGDGFCTAWTSGPPHGGARVDRLTADGVRRWSAPIEPVEVAYDGVVETGVHTNWRVEPMRPWLPTGFRADHWEPLLVSGDRILASYQDPSSGIGLSYFLESDSGRIVASTPPAPTGHKAIVGNGEFLVGAQGYGAFATIRYDRDGTAIARWSTHGAMLVNRRGDVRGVELENVLPSRSRFRGLNGDGSLVDGPPLPGYDTAYPAMDEDGVVVFWRDGKLLTVDTTMTLRTLFSADDTRAVMSRVLLLEDGAVSFALADQLLMFRTGLGPLEASVWPCGDGNVQGNPVALVS